MQMLKKTLMFALLFSCAAIFADNETIAANQKNNESSGFDQGYGIGETQLPELYNAPARIDVKGSWDFFFTGTFLYWEAKERGLDFVYDRPGSTISQDTLNGTSYDIHFPKFEYKCGFKVGAGMNWEHDSWTTYVEYMRFHNLYNSGRHVYNYTALRGTSTWWNADVFIESPSNYLQTIWADWNLKMDILDFKLSRAMYRGNHLNLKPFAGLRGGWIDQYFTVSHIFSNSTNRTFYTRSNSKSWILGPRIGLDSNWIFGSGFSFFGNIAASLLYQDFDVYFKDFYYYDYTDVHTTYYNVSDTKHTGRLTPNLDMIVGFDWGTYFSKDKWHFAINAGYELEIYWNQNRMRELAELVDNGLSDNTGNLYLMGLTASARIDF